MLDTIILLTGETELPALTACLLGHNLHLTILAVCTLADLLAVPSSVLRRARLIGFSTPVVVPREILDRLGYGAYNFHPGSPEFPGWAPASFAVYRRAAEFGATAHMMTERVDEGPIIGVDRFSVSPGSDVAEVERLAYFHLARLFWRFAKDLATRSMPLPVLPVRWNGRKTSRKIFQAMCDIPLDISKEELDRRLKAFGGNCSGVSPAINLHGVRFALSPDTAASRAPGIPPLQTGLPALAV